MENTYLIDFEIGQVHRSENQGHKMVNGLYENIVFRRLSLVVI